MDNTLILVVDDDENMYKFASLALEDLGKVIYSSNGKEALKKIVDLDIDVVVTDIDMPHLDGAKLLEILKQEQRVSVPVIMVTGVGIRDLTPIQSAVRCMKLGAFDYLDKQDMSLENLQDVVKRALSSRKLLKDFTRSDLNLDIPSFNGSPKKIIGNSEKFKEVFQKVMKVANTNVNVIIFGETGTGKEMVAQAIHYTGQRQKGPFVPVNCAAIPGELLESELFGHEKGAFTGATKTKRGKFEKADGGTLFLDEVAEMSLEVQVKLLRFLQERVIERLGGLEFLPIDVRIIAATNQDLEKAVKEGTFRKDLYYRLNVVPIHIPPLREHRDDIPLLVDYILHRECSAQGITEEISVSLQAMEALINYDWPGNIRELENVIARSLALHTKTFIQVEDLSLPQLDSDSVETSDVLQLIEPQDNDEILSLKEIEKKSIRRALEITDGDIPEAAKALEIGRATIYRKIKQYGLNHD